MKKTLLFLLVLSLTFLVSLTSVSAQDTPLVFTMNGDLWKWTPGDAQPEQMTHWGYNFRPVISPDGTHVAYKSWAEAAVNSLDDPAMGQGEIPGNIWVMEITTLEAERIADQPAGVTAFEGGIFRSDPAWSPDGNMLAWVEMVNAGTFALQLVTYDFTTGTSKVIVTPLPAPFMDGGVYLPPVKWGLGGISYNVGSYSEAEGDFVQTMYVYEPDGSLISETPVANFDSSYVVEDFWMGDTIGLVYSSGAVAILNPAEGTVESATGLAVLQADGGVAANALMMAVQPTKGNPSWYIIDNFMNNLGALPYTEVTTSGRLAPGPDGMSFAYITDALYVWSQGEVIQVPGTQGIGEGFPGATVAWAAEYWYIQSDATNPETSACPNNVPARLVIGQQAVVIPGLGSNVIRTEPHKGDSSAVIGSIPEGGQFTVLQGPACGDGITWWLVDYEGVVGWTGESESQTYWVEPR